MTGGNGYPYRGSVLPPSHGAAFEVAEEEFPYPYNPDRARELLEEYAAEKGLSLPLDSLGAFTCTAEQKALDCVDRPAGEPITIIVAASPANTQRAELSQAYYEAVGFDVELVIGAGDEATKTFVTKEAGFSLRGFGLRPHPSGSLDNYFGSGGSLNAGGWSLDPAQIEMDRLVKEAGATFDLEQQNTLYQQAQKIYMEAALGGVKTATEPSYHFAQPWVKMDKDIRVWLKFASDESVKVYDIWLDR
jgi:ABC-type transport system substrate-binding protein